MRDIEFSVGLACYPKLNTEQENYVSSLHDTSEVGAIVVTANPADMDFISTVLEVMAREAGRTIIPAYYEEALKIKYVNGSDDAAMIDLIHDNIASPSTLIFFDAAISGVFLQSINAGKTDFASAYAAKAESLEKELSNLIADYTEIAGQ
jgi:hypothetical protein